MPPQGLLTIAAYVPKRWEVRFVDENIRRAGETALAWADAVLVSGMHVPRSMILDINERAYALGKATAIGGPSVSGEPDAYGAFDYLHIGEMGDATDRLIALIDSRPGATGEGGAARDAGAPAARRLPAPGL